MTEDESERYVHEPLPSKTHIRLLTLRGTSFGDALNIDIDTVDIKGQHPTYEALSYVWGPQIPVARLACHNARSGASLLAGPNLAQALITLRFEHQPRILWVDAVCISQKDSSERAQQVQLMADIYRHADRVLIWLGCETAATRVAFDHISGISAQYESKKRRPSTAPRAIDHGIRYPDKSHAGWEAVRGLLRNEWFTRVWTMQEVAFATQAALYCGSMTLPWTHLENMLLCLVSFPFGRTFEDNALLRGSDKVAFQMCTARHCHRGNKTLNEDFIKGGNFDLITLIDNLRENDATDPRDKVYALLNVAIDNPTIAVDYNSCIAEVYAKTAKWAIAKHQNLSILAQVEKKDKQDLISWVPDFRSKDALNFMFNGKFFTGFLHRFHAAGGTRTPPGPVAAAPLLQLPVRGIRVGTLLSKTGPAGNLIKGVTLGEAVLDGGEWHTFARSYCPSGTYGPTGELVDDAFHRLRIWNTMPAQEVSDRRRSDRKIGNLTDIGDIIHTPTPGFFFNFSGDQESIGSRILSATTRKCMFWTDTGYLGITRRMISVFDEVYVLLGADMPVVLRHVGGRMYSFEGQAYIHGIMDGELIVKARAESKMANEVSSEHDREWLESLIDLNLNELPFKTEELILV